MTEMTTAELASGVEYADISLYAETCPCGTVVPMSDHGHDDHWALMEQARQRVAAGGASTIESAVWSITHKAGYVHGLSDARNGSSRDVTGASDGYAAGYASGYKWGATHPAAVRCAEGSPVSFLLVQQSEDPRLAGGPDAILGYGPDAIEMEDVPTWLRTV